MWPNLQETVHLVKFIEEILNGKLHFLCSELSKNFENEIPSSTLIVDLPWKALAIWQKLRKASFSEVTCSLVLLPLANLAPSNLAPSWTLLHWLLACPTLASWTTRFILLVPKKEVISMSYSSNINSWKPWRWMRRKLILSMRVT